VILAGFLERPYARRMFGLVLRRSLLLLAFLIVASGCAVEGTTPDCPKMPEDPDPTSEVVDAWRKAAAEAGCLTPLGEPFAPASGGSP
jgi:hypothetical protein